MRPFGTCKTLRWSNRQRSDSHLRKRAIHSDEIAAEDRRLHFSLPDAKNWPLLITSFTAERTVSVPVGRPFQYSWGRLSTDTTGIETSNETTSLLLSGCEPGWRFSISTVSKTTGYCWRTGRSARVRAQLLPRQVAPYSHRNASSSFRASLNELSVASSVTEYTALAAAGSVSLLMLYGSLIPYEQDFKRLRRRVKICMVVLDS